MSYRFSVTDRDGKKALWVNSHNIWDISPKELTEDVKQVVIHAYEPGINAAEDEIIAELACTTMYTYDYCKDMYLACRKDSELTKWMLVHKIKFNPGIWDFKYTNA
jgi:hypothetical protein